MNQYEPGAPTASINGGLLLVKDDKLDQSYAAVIGVSKIQHD
ncbi:hypothetical protein [Flexithrix dorotheae]|nr:hypothetical protein [Flexithrix dorotheae]